MQQNHGEDKIPGKVLKRSTGGAKNGAPRSSTFSKSERRRQQQQRHLNKHQQPKAPQPSHSAACRSVSHAASVEETQAPKRKSGVALWLPLCSRILCELDGTEANATCWRLSSGPGPIRHGPRGQRQIQTPLASVPPSALCRPVLHIIRSVFVI